MCCFSNCINRSCISSTFELNIAAVCNKMRNPGCIHLLVEYLHSAFSSSVASFTTLLTSGQKDFFLKQIPKRIIWFDQSKYMQLKNFERKFAAYGKLLNPQSVRIIAPMPLHSTTTLYLCTLPLLCGSTLGYCTHIIFTSIFTITFTLPKLSYNTRYVATLGDKSVVLIYSYIYDNFNWWEDIQAERLARYKIQKEALPYSKKTHYTTFKFTTNGFAIFFGEHNLEIRAKFPILFWRVKELNIKNYYFLLHTL